MSVHSVLKRMERTESAKDTETLDTVPKRPDPNLIAFCVAYSREMKQMSIQALASVAGVSLSSVERIERGEHVSDDTLRKVAVAVNQDEDAFIAERLPCSEEEAEQALLASWVEPFKGMTMVSVAPFTKQLQVRSLSRSDGIIVHSAHLHEDAQSLVENLREWLDLASFIRATQEIDILNTGKSFTRMRELNRDVLAAVREIERVGCATALTGFYDAEGLYVSPTTATSTSMAIKAALVAFFPKATDPCAIKRQILWAPRKLVFEL